MVKKVLDALHREIGGIHEAAYLLAVFAIASQLLALARDRLFAYTFGATHTLDVYYAAFRIPDFIFVSIASMVSISVLVPLFAEKLRDGNPTGKRFIDSTFSIFFLAIVTVSLVVFFIMPLLAPLVLPGFNGHQSAIELIMLARIMLLSPILLGVSNFLASITQVHNRFFIYAVSPLLYNLGIIFGIAVLYPFMGISGLAWGVVIGAFLHLFIQVPFIVEKGLFPRFYFEHNVEAIRNVVLVSLPRTLTLSANQIATFFLVSLASLMSTGSIAVFNFSWNLQSVPLSIVGVSYASAAFPTLARLIAGKQYNTYLEHMIMSARHVIFWSLPMMTLFVVLRAQIVRTILGAGNFNWSDTRLTAACLAIFILSVVPQSLLLLFVRGYYALGQTRKPLLINIISSVFLVVLGYGFLALFKGNIVFRYFLERLFRVEDVPGSIVLVLPLAYTLGTTINALWHWVSFEFEFSGFSRPVMKTALTSFASSVIMGYVAYYFLSVFDDLFHVKTVVGIFLQGLCSGVVGIVAGILVLFALKNDEIVLVWKTLHRKIFRAHVVGPDSETEPRS